MINQVVVTQDDTSTSSVSGRPGYDLFHTLKGRAMHVKAGNTLASFDPFLKTELQFLS